jgi:hypothetical protein
MRQTIRQENKDRANQEQLTEEQYKILEIVNHLKSKD